MFYFSIAKLLFISPNNFSNQLLVCQDGVHDFLSSSQVGDSDSRTPLAAIAESRSDAFSRSDCFCLNVSEMRHCVWNASLCLKCVIVAEMRHCVWNASVSLRYLPGTKGRTFIPKVSDSSSRVRSKIWIEPTTLSRSESKTRIEPTTLSRSGSLVSGFGKWPAFQSKPAQQLIICSLVLYWGKQVSCIHVGKTNVLLKQIHW